MPDTATNQVRKFNRTVTQRVGALNNSFLALDRPLSEARILWEIGTDGCEVRALRNRLGLDSGHASRLLRSLEAAELVRVSPSRADRRIRIAELTPAGIAERALLDERSDDLAESMLAPLDPGQRERLLDAMRTVERLLSFGATRSGRSTPIIRTRGNASGHISTSLTAGRSPDSTPA
jgi:DNA-binding MarR family transcriptional regulator